jgi:hypothetical protein
LNSKMRQTVVVCGIIILMMLSSCGNQDDNSQSELQSSKTKSAQNSNKEYKGKIKGQEIKIDQFKFVIPNDWKGNKDTQVWFPGTEDANVPLPPHSLHHGARPLMGIPSFAEGIKTHVGMQPVEQKSTKVGKMDGIICKWQRGSYKCVGLFLLEKSVGMDIMYFFTCQAPAASFDQSVDTYQSILKSVSLN